MLDENQLQKVTFKINTSSLYLNYCWNSMDGSLENLLTYNLKKTPNLGDIIDFSEYLEKRNVVQKMIVDFKTATFKIIERCCYIAEDTFSSQFDNWLITLEPCSIFKSQLSPLFLDNIEHELIEKFDLSPLTTLALNNVGLYENTTVQNLAEKFELSILNIPDENILEIKNIIELYLRQKK